MSWAPAQRPDVSIRPVATPTLPVEFRGIAFYFLTLKPGERVSFASYYRLPEPRVLRTDMAVTGKGRFRGEKCFEVERHTYDEAGKLTARSLFYLALTEREVRWLLRIRRNPGEDVNAVEPTATFPRHLATGLKWGHRTVGPIVDVVINGNSFRCLEIESVTPLDPHLNRLYIDLAGRQVYNHRYLRTDAPKPFAIPADAETLSHGNMRYASYYEDFPDFALRPRA